MRRAIVLVAALLAGCNNMARQPRYDAYGKGALFADGKAMQSAPDGTVSRDAPALEEAAMRPAMSPGLLARGRERYDIYCSMCHGIDGAGDGTVTAHGFPRPADFHEDAQRILTPDQIYQAISTGKGAMYGFADRVPAKDRWAMTAYVLALQRGDRR